jgi:PAS domain S-box-containing protein
MMPELPLLTTVSFLQGGGEMGARIRAFDWAKTPLGAPEHWQQSLKTAVRIMLTSRQPMWVWWGEELINLYNDAYRPILGGKHPDMLGQPAGVVWREIWDQVGPRAESVMFQNEATYDESLLLIMERNGYPEETYYTFSYSPIPDDQGGTGGILCANTDDTQRVIGERQLALLRELAAKTADARTFDEACTLSAQGLETNPYDLPFALIYLVDADLQQGYLAGSSQIDRSYLPETIALTQDSVWCFHQVLQSQQPVIVSDLPQHLQHLPTGIWQQVPHQAVVMPIVASGKTGIFIGGLNPFRLFDDHYQCFLNLVSSQIAASIANAQAYEEERKRAEALAELDRAKTVFFSNVSHEFRTPLTLMLGPTADALSDPNNPLPPLQRERIEIVQRNGQRLLKLVNTLLDFSRIEAGRIQASYEPTDLAALTADLASIFRSAIERANLQLIVDCPPLPEPIYVDREMWEKIVLNLLSNAFKFTLAGEISVGLQWQDTHIQLTVQDTGTGIPATELPHLFERFHRVKGAQGRSFEGSGIGLSLVQELVKLHQGTIEVASVEGEGTCFTILIPTGTAHLPQDRIRAVRTLTSTASSINAYVEEALSWLPESDSRLSILDFELTSAKPNIEPTPPDEQTQPLKSSILLVDDNADMRSYVQRLLAQQYQVDAVSDGLAALAAVHHQIPDLILTDIMMPHLDGFGLLQALRADPQTREIPIILLSARAGEEARVEGLAAGADDYLTKPFSARELMVRVEASLKLAQLRREAGVALRESEAQFRNMADQAPFMVWVTDPTGYCTYLSQSWYDFTGQLPATGLGFGWLDRTHPDDRPQAERTFLNANAQQEAFRLEYRLQRRDGEYIWALNAANPRFGVDGQFKGYVGSVIDISDLKQAEASLRESEARFRQVADTAPMLIWMAGTDKLCNYFNQSWLNFTGRTIEQEMGNRWAEGIHPEDAQHCLGIYNTAFDQRRPFEMDYRLKRFDGEYRWILDAGVPRFTPDGQFLGYIGSCVDIHERKQLEVEQARILQLEQSTRAKAEQANRIKDEFLAVLSHELRTPLNPILAWAKLLQTRKFNEAKTAQALETIERNAKLQAELIEDLLNVSRILQGKLSLSIYPVNLEVAVRNAIETVRLAAEARSITLETDLDPAVGQVAGDATRLQQIAWNLLSNAVKFTPTGGRVTVRLQRMGTEVELIVSDTGKGIAPNFLPHVFDYFRQEDGTTTRTFGGLGLGLAIVRHLVELHGGTVSAQSDGEGLGATFTVRLPLILATPLASADSNLPELTSDLSGVQALVVDDEADSRDVIAFILEQAGASVRTATSATEALSILRHVKLDILLSDIGMPEMDGYSLIQQVRMLPTDQGGTVLAIALTAYAGDLAQQQAVQAGFQHHIAKPVEPDVLVQEVAWVCKQR